MNKKAKRQAPGKAESRPILEVRPIPRAPTKAEIAAQKKHWQSEKRNGLHQEEDGR